MNIRGNKRHLNIANVRSRLQRIKNELDLIHNAINDHLAMPIVSHEGKFQIAEHHIAFGKTRIADAIDGLNT